MVLAIEELSALEDEIMSVLPDRITAILSKLNSDYTLICNVCPEVVKRHFWDTWGINFETNEINIQNKE